jgi:hypothetical protein
MALGEIHAAGLRLTDSSTLVEGPPVPLDGLNEVLRGWNGKGQLWDALAMIPDEVSGRKWSRVDVEKRAHRILFPSLAPYVELFPKTLQAWLDGLPAESVGFRQVTSSPSSGVSWRETRIKFGWPPTGFVTKTRSRTADTLLVTTLRWVAETLNTVRSNAVAVEKSLEAKAQAQIVALDELMKVPPLLGAQAIRPTAAELRAITREGSPWSAVSQVAKGLLRLDGSLEDLATSLLMPDAEVRGRLFHLGVFGCVLMSLRSQGAEAVSIRPLSGTTTGPCYKVCDASGKEWDLWFEAGGVWSHYKIDSPYVKATKDLCSGNAPLTPDIMILRPHKRALIIECKYSFKPDYVGRNGLTQAMAYATEAKTALVKRVESVAIGPEDVVRHPTHVETVAGSIGVGSPTSIDQCVKRLLTGG